jgi:hypothetical protein
MSFIITQGYGNPGTSNYLTLVSVLQSGGQIDLGFSQPVTISGAAASPTGYTITATDGGVPLIVSSVSVVSGKIRLLTNEPTNGKAYTVYLPLTGILSGSVGLFGPYNISFIASSVAPYIITAHAVNGRTLEVVFSETVREDDATNVANYSISPALDILAAVKVTDTIYRLTTSRQTQNVIYTVTSTNIRDLANNPE